MPKILPYILLLSISILLGIIGFSLLSSYNTQGNALQATKTDSEILIHALNYEIDTQETQYVCFTVDTLEANEYVYITGFEPLLDTQAPSASLVHHFVLSVAQDDEELGTRPCKEWPGEPIWSWTTGSSGITFPSDVSMRLGSTTPTRLTLQMHYHNPDHATGIIDTSGVVIHYTKTPRPVDAGMLIFGSIFDIQVAAGKTIDFTAPRCTAEDTEKMGPITIFASSLHAHELGKALWADQYRDGKLIGEINRNDAYEFAAQHFVEGNWPVLPGDELEMHCIYENDTDHTVQGGPASTDEMCLNFTFYYPKTPYNFCGGKIHFANESGLR